jgi:DNA topoisomerase III
MHVAERLYLSGYISYPRTESTHYADSFNFDSIINNLKTSSSTKIATYAAKMQF